ncbi:hypothetical protein LZ012_06245 [Dechloromonas sp. XY25]|uniref:Uncharacterized protein n=1 Tax=Dechloromonas hankyongensis TaxID=2908002 RepID=A0ABS9K0A5_9RHOO|nr:hypothetical protein [Dechloromonas hankyongensis]MCG2576595.1 hypothetical protein [Dechloromonas hankyongensis]
MWRVILTLLLTLSNAVAQADSAPLGRLFFDADQRAILDQQRQRNPWFGQQNDNTETGQTFNGEVRSSSGRRTRWINGEADWNTGSPAPRVPVGNTYYPESGQSVSLLGGGRIVVRPARPMP